MPENAAARSFDVTVVGCGLMGSALARAFAAGGLAVAAWNRTPARARALAGDNITPVESLADTVGMSTLVVACTSTYDTTRAALDPVIDWGGAELVNVGTGTPAEAEAMAHWAADRHVGYLDGAILCYPPQIGTEDGMIVYSGSSEVWATHRDTLSLLGPHSTWVSDDITGAGAAETAMTGAFYVSALTAYIEAMTYALGHGISRETMKSLTRVAIATLAATADEAVDAIADDAHQTSTATLGVYAEGCRAALGAIQATGHRATMLATAVQALGEAERAGLGDLGFFALAKLDASPIRVADVHGNGAEGT
ncbi:NAD(P)-binding domain-containing protein [Nocardia sp. NPDC002869]|uniref:NAD(P)-binding domain-containing protein n=1 Tax=Nocardia sp. NPDC002869 TaxID=3161032 RepID=UPI00398CEFF2